MDFNNEFCSYNQSLLLKSIGFNYACIAFYDRNNPDCIVRLDSDEYIDDSTVESIESKYGLVDVLPAPLLQQAFRFFTSNGLYNDVKRISEGNWEWKIECDGLLILNGFSKSHAECVQDCLNKLIDEMGK
jgi:hypothetical protein